MGYILKIYPENEQYLPDAAQEEDATDVLNEIFSDSGDIDSNSYQDVVYVDAGNSIRSVICPQCGASINVSSDDGLAEWWKKCIEKQQIEGGDAEIIAPCCNKAVSFKLTATVPATGFARFVIEIHEPEQVKELTAHQLENVGEAIGCSCHQIMAFYND